MIDPQSLIWFAQVVKHGSFAAAARAGNLPTTTLSRKIAQLEEVLDGKLLQRSTRSLSLTELGRELLPQAELISETLQMVRETSERSSRLPRGRLTISCSRAIAQYCVADWLAGFCASYPLVEVSLEITNHYADLFAGSLDFAFRVGPLADANIIAKPLFDSVYKLVASPDYLSKWGAITHPDRLEQLPCLQAVIDRRSQDWVLYRNGGEFRMNPEGVIVADDLNVVAQLARRGGGFAYLPEIVVRQSLREGSLVEVLPQWQARARTVYLVYPDRKHLPSKSRAFIDYMDDTLRFFDDKSQLT